jgi:hypothetical protein
MKYKLTLITLLFSSFVFAQSFNPNQINSTPTHVGYDYYSGNPYYSGAIKACSAALKSAEKNNPVNGAKCPETYLGVMGYQGFVNGGGFKTISNPAGQAGSRAMNATNSINRN